MSSQRIPLIRASFQSFSSELEKYNRNSSASNFFCLKKGTVGSHFRYLSSKKEKNEQKTNDK